MLRTGNIYCTETSDDKGRLKWLINRGGVLLRLNNPERAMEDLEAAVGLAIKTNERSFEAKALINLGTAFAQIGKSEAAATSYRRALTIGKELEDSEMIQTASDRLGLFFSAP